MKQLLSRIFAYATLLIIVNGCAGPQASQDTSVLTLEQAIQVATDGAVMQTQRLPGFLANVEAKLSRRGLVIDPPLDATSGQQTALTRLLEQKITERVRSEHPQFEVLPFQSLQLAKATYLLTATIAKLNPAQSDGLPVFQINVALTEMKNGTVVAQASARARDSGFDTTPTPYYRDSPVQVKDKIVDGYILTTAMTPGRSADVLYFSHITTAVTVNAAIMAYNNERYDEAYALYKTAAAAPAGEQLRVLNGLYLANWKLGKVKEAEESFGKLVAFGLSNNSLGVKFLFNPGTTQFWSDTKVAGAYGLWLRQIARQAASMKVCMNVVGHTSRTGSEQYNDRLSKDRAVVIKQKLEQEASELASRIHEIGKGFRENILGTGTDDARDALDRRVEFKVVGC